VIARAIVVKATCVLCCGYVTVHDLELVRDTDLILCYDFNDFRVAGPVTYVFQLAENGPLKIGYTAKLRKRYHAIQASVPYPVMILGMQKHATAMEAEQYESALLELCHAFRLHGEWFCAEARTLLKDLIEPMPTDLKKAVHWRNFHAAMDPVYTVSGRRRRRRRQRPHGTYVLVPESIWNQVSSGRHARKRSAQWERLPASAEPSGSALVQAKDGADSGRTTTTI